MKVSLVIPTLNAQNCIAGLIMMLRQQTLPLEDILVVDSSSDDQTVKVAQELGCRTTVIERTMFDHGSARNMGAGFCNGQILVFMTQDAMPVNDKFVENLVRPLKKPNIAASFGRQIAKPDATPPEKFARLYNYPETGAIKGKADLPKLGLKTFFFSNVCSAVKRQEFESVGGFPERIIMNEDMLLAAKLIFQGFQVAYEPEALVWHSHDYSAFQQFKRYFDIGVFIRMNNWIVDYGKAEGEGFRFIKEQFAFLLRHGHYRWIPHSLALTMAKYAGYKLGLMEDKLPASLKRIFSLHKGFWN